MDTTDWNHDVAPEVVHSAAEAGVDVPTHYDVLPDGRRAVVFGDVAGSAKFNHVQGQNQLGYRGDCGLMSCTDVLNQFGVPVTEDQVVTHAASHGECEVTDDLDMAGGTSPEQGAQVLCDLGLPARAEIGHCLEDLAGDVERGHGVMTAVNAGILWNDPNFVENGFDNHMVTVTGVARDPNTGQIEGFYINDSSGCDKGSYGQDHGSAHFVDAKTMTKAWLEAGGGTVVTDAVHTAPHGTLIAAAHHA